MKKLLIVLVVLFLLALLVGIGSCAWLLRSSTPTLAENTWLELDFSQPPTESVADDPVAVLLQHKQPRLLDLVVALDRAAEDDRIAGVLAYIPGAPIGLGQVQELRQAVARFRESGKSTVAYADTFGEWSAANGAYYLASAFEKVHVQPSGDVGLTGLAYETPFLRGTLDKLGVEAQIEGRYEYKNAANTFTETSYTEAHREAMQAILDSQFSQVVEGIATSRGLTPEAVRQRIDGGPFFGQEAVEAGLVDSLAYRDQIYAEAAGGEDAELKTIGPAAYVKAARRRGSPAATVALIYGVGQVVRGPSKVDPFSGSSSMGSDTVGQAFRDAVDDDDVRGILFRVDSPGGSYVASDSIRRELMRAQEAGKPVVVSMGNVAGSGGYFVAMDADHVVAQPGTITGSIGVLGGKLVTRDLFAKLGLTFDGVESSEHAGIWSANRPYTEEEWVRVRAALDRIYEDFTRKAAAGRGLPLEELQRVARGRIWSGADALDLKLVDELGGYHEALRALKERIDVDPEARVALRHYPRARTPWQAILAQLQGQQAGLGQRDALREVLTRLQPLIELVGRLGLTGETAAPLRAPAADLATTP